MVREHSLHQKSTRLIVGGCAGGSTASLRYDEHLRCAVFEGSLDLSAPEGVDNSGFAAMVLRDQGGGGWDLEDYHALVLRARTDGRMYVTNLRAPSRVEGDLWQAYTQGPPGVMADIVLPFEKFVLTQHGFVEGQLALDAREVESVGVLMAQRRAGPFRIDIEGIDAIDLRRMLSGRWTGMEERQ